MKAGDIFYSVMQKDNNPFEKPRITKFVVKNILNDCCTHPIVSTKTDKWGRQYMFKKSQIYLNYKDAIPEKQKIQERIRQWEKDVEEINKKYFEEQERKEKQRQLEYEKQIRADERKQVCDEIRKLLKPHYGEEVSGFIIERVLDQIQGENND